MCSHPEEGQEDRPVNGALHVGHRRGGGQGGEVQASRSLMQVGIEAPLQRIIKDHLVEETDPSSGGREGTFTRT